MTSFVHIISSVTYPHHHKYYATPRQNSFELIVHSVHHKRFLASNSFLQRTESPGDEQPSWDRARSTAYAAPLTSRTSASAISRRVLTLQRTFWLYSSWVCVSSLTRSRASFTMRNGFSQAGSLATRLASLLTARQILGPSELQHSLTIETSPPRLLHAVRKREGRQGLRTNYRKVQYPLIFFKQCK